MPLSHRLYQVLLLFFKDWFAGLSCNRVVVSADSRHESVFEDRFIHWTHHIIRSLKLGVRLHLSRKNAHRPVACILLNTGLIVLVNPPYISQHLSVDVLSARDLLMVQPRHCEYIVYLVYQWCLNLVEISHYSGHLLIDIFGDGLDFFEKEVSLLFKLRLVLK